MPISFTPEVIFHIGSFAVTNSLLTSWIVVGVIVIFAIIAGSRLKERPRGLQNFVEWMIEKLQNMVEGVTENAKQAKFFFPLVASFFLYIIMANWIGLLPGFGTIGIVEPGSEEVVPIFRAATADLNLTIVLAAITVVTVQVVGIASLGFFKYAKRFLNFSNPMKFFVGLLELVGEVAKLVSFSFRLFGNVFAGEVLLVVMTYLVTFIVPVPFIALEIFVGFIQAFVFAMLTLVFLKMSTVESH